MPQFPAGILGVILWIVVIVVLCLAAVFLFQGIVLPLIKTITH